MLQLKTNLFKMKTLILIASISGLSFTPTDGGEWPQKAQQGFINSCIPQAKNAMKKKQAQAYCSCMLDKMMAIYPDPKDAIPVDTEKIKELAESCVQDILSEK